MLSGEQRVERAWEELHRLTSAPGGPGVAWRWSIPANPDRDSDLLLGDGLKALTEQLGADREEVAYFREARDNHRAALDRVEAERDRARDLAAALEAELAATVAGLADVQKACPRCGKGRHNVRIEWMWADDVCEGCAQAMREEGS